MRIFKSTLLILLAALSLSSCLVAGPGYGYRGGGYRGGPGFGRYNGGHGGNHHGGYRGGYRGGQRGGGGGHYRR